MIVTRPRIPRDNPGSDALPIVFALVICAVISIIIVSIMLTQARDDHIKRELQRAPATPASAPQPFKVMT